MILMSGSCDIMSTLVSVFSAIHQDSVPALYCFSSTADNKCWPECCCMLSHLLTIGNSILISGYSILACSSPLAVSPWRQDSSPLQCPGDALLSCHVWSHWALTPGQYPGHWWGTCCHGQCSVLPPPGTRQCQHTPPHYLSPSSSYHVSQSSWSQVYKISLQFQAVKIVFKSKNIISLLIHTSLAKLSDWQKNDISLQNTHFIVKIGWFINLT